METTTRICALRELIPATPIHPGEMIKDELQAQGVSQRPITNDTALKIEAATGITANLWIGLQSDYNIQTARRDSGLSAVLDQTRKTVAAL